MKVRTVPEIIKTNTVGSGEHIGKSNFNIDVSDQEKKTNWALIWVP